MATKAKAKSKSIKKTAKRPAPEARKSLSLKAKARGSSGNGGALGPAPSAVRSSKHTERLESRKTTGASSMRATSPPAVRSRHFASAVQAYEAAIKLMHNEEFEKAIRCFEDVVSEHAEEPEIQERAKVLIHACEKKLQEKARTVFRSADDHYNVGIAELNRRETASAIHHLEHALKLTPKADHVLYALAAANALQGNSTEALSYLKQAVSYRPENRFLAVRDSDFESLQENSEFRQLVTTPEK